MKKIYFTKMQLFEIRCIFFIWSLFFVIKTQPVSGSWDKPGSFLCAFPFCIGVKGLSVHRHHCEITVFMGEEPAGQIKTAIFCSFTRPLLPHRFYSKSEVERVKLLPQNCEELQPAGSFNLSSSVSSNPDKQTGASREVQGEVQRFRDFDSCILTLTPNAFSWYVLSFIRNSRYSEFSNSSMLD